MDKQSSLENDSEFSILKGKFEKRLKNMKNGVGELFTIIKKVGFLIGTNHPDMILFVCKIFKQMCENYCHFFERSSQINDIIEKYYTYEEIDNDHERSKILLENITLESKTSIHRFIIQLLRIPVMCGGKISLAKLMQIGYNSGLVMACCSKNE
jgi:hypothetical protein